MKSLKIVNEIIKDFEKGEMRPLYIEKSMNKIKQDLEVLEIIYKKNVDLGFLKFVFMKITDLDEALETYNYGGLGNYLTMEELLKLKQWLEREEKEND